MTQEKENWEDKLMDQFAVTFERAQDNTVVDRLESFISQLLTTEREKAYDEGYVARGGAESERKQQMYDGGISVGKAQAYAKVREVVEKQKNMYAESWPNIGLHKISENILVEIKRLAKEGV